MHLNFLSISHPVDVKCIHGNIPNGRGSSKGMDNEEAGKQIAAGLSHAV
jgi:hypothetical protein